ncbi:MAG TPA: hypothetical protein PKK99_11480, partial [Bacteroidia bacterium]|nr:hypothetical protein [Bacteroidia bacterium]
MKKQLQKLLSGVVFLSLPLISIGANPHGISTVSNNPSSSAESLFHGARVKSGVLIIKVKPELRSFCSVNSISESKLQSVFQLASVQSVEKKFPKKEAPVQSQSRGSVKPVDLSLIYQLRLANGVSLEKSIEQLMESGSVEYAEPMYLNFMDYTPNDPQIATQYQNGKI